jgi:nucleotidyltransferase/DNA polymerase involved in DNA repair
MFVKEARKHCPEVVLLLANPELYENLTAATRLVYQILLHITPHINPISCDEMTIHISNADGYTDPSALAVALREHIHRATGCTFSVGIGHTAIMAR